MVPKLQLVMLLSLRVIASITTDLYVVVSTIATCMLLFRLLRTCMLLFWLLSLAYPVSFIAHLLLPFRLLCTCCCRFDRYLPQSVTILQSIFSLRFFNYAVIWLGEEGFCLMTRFIYAWYHLCCVHWSARYRESNLAFPRAFLVIFVLIGFRFLSKVFIKRIYSA